MLSIIIAFPKIEDAQNIKKILLRTGYEIDAVCTTGAQVVNIASELDGGILLCGYRLADMHYRQLHTDLPKGFEMLLIASAAKLEECVDNDIVCLSMPIKTVDLIHTLQMMTSNYNRRRKKQKMKPKQRSEAEKQIIVKAKQVLMERNNMSEEEAHRYIQKHSMNNGTNLVETAEMVLSIKG